MTTARVSVEDDRRRRMRNYLIAMGVRIVGFPVSVWLLLNGYVVVGAALAVVATVVPSIAVVVANAVDHRGASAKDSSPASPVRGLGPGATAAAPGPREPAGPREPGEPATADDGPILGTVVSSRDVPAPRHEDEGRGGGGPSVGGHVDLEAS